MESAPADGGVSTSTVEAQAEPSATPASSANVNQADSVLQQPVDPRNAAAARIRASAQHKVVGPLVAEALNIIADHVDGEWISDSKVASIALTARRLVAYESENTEARERLSVAERKASDFNGQLSSILSSEQQSRLLQELAEMREQNSSLLRSNADQMGALFDARVENLATDNADLRKKVRELEQQLNEARKELVKLQAASTSATGEPKEGASEAVPEPGVMKQRKPVAAADRDAGMPSASSQ